MVWRLDRLGRSLKEPIEVAGELEEHGVGFKSLKETLDTTTPSGKVVLNVFTSLAEFGRAIIRERTMAGLRRRGSGEEGWQESGHGGEKDGPRRRADAGSVCAHL